MISSLFSILVLFSGDVNVHIVRLAVAQIAINNISSPVPCGWSSFDVMVNTNNKNTNPIKSPEDYSSDNQPSENMTQEIQHF